MLAADVVVVDSVLKVVAITIKLVACSVLLFGGLEIITFIHECFHHPIEDRLFQKTVKGGPCSDQKTWNNNVFFDFATAPRAKGSKLIKSFFLFSVAARPDSHRGGMSRFDEFLRRLRNTLTQGVHYVMKLPFVILFAGWMTLTLSRPGEADIVKFIENTSLTLLVSPRKSCKDDKTKRRYYIIHEENLNICLRHQYGAKVTCATNEVLVVYSRISVGGNYQDAMIHTFLVDGKQVKCAGMQLSVLETLGLALTHPASHIFSNDLIFRLLDLKNQGLLGANLTPSTHTTLELHRGLMSSNLSPIFLRAFGIPSPGSISVTPHSLARLAHEHDPTGSIMLRFAGHPLTIQAIQSPFVGFLLKSRKVFRKCMTRYDIPMELLEPMWLHTVVHAVDHHQSFKLGMFQHSTMTEPLAEAPIWRIFTLNTWRVMFERPHLNPLADNKIKNIREPFYQDLYKGLANLDVELADQVTASVMY